jgi:ABC-type transport system involved in Fe-S cluster assembly fused permease/ATPase subunit
MLTIVRVRVRKKEKVVKRVSQLIKWMAIEMVTTFIYIFISCLICFIDLDVLQYNVSFVLVVSYFNLWF